MNYLFPLLDIWFSLEHGFSGYMVPVDFQFFLVQRMINLSFLVLLYAWTFCIHGSPGCIVLCRMYRSPGCIVFLLFMVLIGAWFYWMHGSSECTVIPNAWFFWIHGSSGSIWFSWKHSFPLYWTRNFVFLSMTIYLCFSWMYNYFAGGFSWIKGSPQSMVRQQLNLNY